MNKTTLWFTLAFMALGCSFGHAQLLSSIVKDSASQKPLPYVTIQLSNKKGVITNEEGRFNLLLDNGIKETDSLFISCIGYESIAKPLNQFTKSVIYLHPKAIELNQVIVSNKNYTAEEIIDLVKKKIPLNYNFALTKKKLFFRETHRQYLLKSGYSSLESTIKEFNKEFIDSVLSTIPKTDKRYTDVLCELYGDYNKDRQKINMIKASELYDKKSELDLTALEEKLNAIIRKNVKSDSYFKIKSGWFGTKIEADELFEGMQKEENTDGENTVKTELEEAKKKEAQRKQNFSLFKKRTLGNLLQGMFLMEDSKRNFINKSNRYEFTLVDFTYMGPNAVYVLDFKPKRSEDYKGRIYVNSDDFAILRVDYENVKSLRNFRLLGISLNENLSKGKLFFTKGNDNYYQLRYLEKEYGNKVGIKRPLKIIEKNKHVKGRRKQNELSVDIDMATESNNKYEIVVFDTENLSSADYDAFSENNTVFPTYMPRYDPKFWEGYTIIEPNQAIREFTAKE